MSEFTTPHLRVTFHHCNEFCDVGMTQTLHVKHVVINDYNELFLNYFNTLSMYNFVLLENTLDVIIKQKVLISYQINVNI